MRRILITAATSGLGLAVVHSARRHAGMVGCITCKSIHPANSNRLLQAISCGIGADMR